jgi:hypothetical protein
METIKKAMRKENWEFVALSKCEPMEESKERCRVLMEDIQ